jgi:hypothetical protein
METYTGDLAKAYTNKAYQENEERYTMKNECWPLTRIFGNVGHV